MLTTPSLGRVTSSSKVPFRVAVQNTELELSIAESELVRAQQLSGALTSSSPPIVTGSGFRCYELNSSRFWVLDWSLR